ncbi:ATP synthase subunit C lysine N-methyltransferase-like isoform X2 [Acipenser ruthenus]|uniref:ATP synthase subunit C lysine N-methyltransferase-like isoform X2 n=1 Tax=Acipenser ruthenus TaxID=7906 RepID=UPI0027406C01|nr:ATP synthase subunit C lysine N-methyltransferase-like isoform X2 [Acipenser ruthenus]
MSKFLQDSSFAKDSNPGSVGKKRWGLWVTGVVGGTLIALYAVATPFVIPALRKICLPFVPATPAQIANVLKMLQSRTGSLVDIGSGDGRIVKFSQYTNVVVFGVPQMMPQLEDKLLSELQITAKVIACRFPFPTWAPEHMTGEGIDTVWAYDAKSFQNGHCGGTFPAAAEAQRHCNQNTQ